MNTPASHIAPPATTSLFMQDALRWVTPGQIAERDSLSPQLLCKLLVRHLPLRAMAWFRLGSWCKRRRIPGLPGWIQRHIYRRYGLEISVGADIGGGLYIPHPVGTVIAVERMGRNCSVIAAATLGMRNEWAFPRIEDQVFVGAGARVLGGIRVGQRAVIGANAVVLSDVPDDATVVGIPARIVRIKGERARESG